MESSAESLGQFEMRQSSKFWLIILLGVGIIAAFPGFVFCQNYQTFVAELEGIARNATWKVGPFRIYPRIRVGDVGYDNNVYFQQLDAAPVSDYTATVSPEVRVYLVYRNWLMLSFSEVAAYVYYFDEKNERAFNQSYSPGFKILLLHRFVVSGNYQYSRAKMRVTNEFNARIFQTVQGYQARLFYESSSRTSLGFSDADLKISYEDVTYSGEQVPISTALNRREKSGGVDFYYTIFPESNYFLRLGYARYLFDNPQSSFRDSNAYQVSTGIEFPLLGRARGLLSFGYKWFFPRDKRRKKFSGIIGNTNLEFRLGRFNVRARFNRDIPFSYGANLYFIHNFYGAGISFYAMPAIRLDYDFHYAEGKYPEIIRIHTNDGGFRDIKRNDVYRTHTAGVTFRIARNTGISLNLSSWERSSNYDPESRTRLFAGGSLTYEF